MYANTKNTLYRNSLKDRIVSSTHMICVVHSAHEICDTVHIAEWNVISTHTHTHFYLQSFNICVAIFLVHLSKKHHFFFSAFPACVYLCTTIAGVASVLHSNAIELIRGSVYNSPISLPHRNIMHSIHIIIVLYGHKLDGPTPKTIQWNSARGRDLWRTEVNLTNDGVLFFKKKLIFMICIHTAQYTSSNVKLINWRRLILTDAHFYSDPEK